MKPPFQFTLVTLLALVTVAAVAAAFFVKFGLISAMSIPLSACGCYAMQGALKIRNTVLSASVLVLGFLLVIAAVVAFCFPFIPRVQ
jgi:hypothetical protein